MKLKITFAYGLGLLVLVLLLGACNASGNAGFPTGKFVRADNNAHGLVFNKDKSFSVFDGSTTLVHGTYSSTNETFTDESNDAGCPRLNFKYKFDGTKLTFNYVGKPEDDPCAGRRDDFNNVTYLLTK